MKVPSQWQATTSMRELAVPSKQEYLRRDRLKVYQVLEVEVRRCVR